jgi:prophage regulatory protein
MQFLRRKQVENLTGQSRSEIYRGMAKGTFPKPAAKPGPKMPVWTDEQISHWQKQQMAKHTGGKK